MTNSHAVTYTRTHTVTHGGVTPEVTSTPALPCPEVQNQTPSARPPAEAVARGRATTTGPDDQARDHRELTGSAPAGGRT